MILDSQGRLGPALQELHILNQSNLPDRAKVDAGAPGAGDVGEDEPEAVRAVGAALRGLQEGRHWLLIQEGGSGLR